MKTIFGRTFKDKITGFQGIATGYVEYITGCNQILLSPHVGGDNKSNNEWFDEVRLELVDVEPVVLEEPVGNPGPDSPAPIR